ncbi:hypothetical protein JQS30_13230 [Natronoglycomyces albus]|uniref:MmyB-like transcription regulator ligand binding domain-containing protein n=2 Tax=Natronoglycomyces albus TaxID=2811108 RepID=A0A895XMF9_9ACTN|nr:hypothetical protein JQS30_13230 [Natronoglycomyces albus]
MRKRIIHPRLGPVEVQCLILHVPDSDIRIVAYVTEAGSSSRAAIDSLHTSTQTAKASNGAAQKREDL